MALQSADDLSYLENGARNGAGHTARGGGICMSKKLPFIVLCLEEYRKEKNMSGKAVIELFDRYDVCNYLKTFYEALHTTGTKYIVHDIDAYIQSRQAG